MTRLINIVFYSAIVATVLCGAALAYLLVLDAPSQKVEARAPAAAPRQAETETPRDIVTGSVAAPEPSAPAATREAARRDADGERIPVWLAPTTRYKASELAMPAAPSTSERSLDGQGQDGVERISEKPYTLEVETPAPPAPPPVVVSRQKPAYDSPFYNDRIQ